jgi:hypothetical protein
VEAEMRVYIWCDGAAMPNGGPAGAGYVVVGGVHLLGSEALGDATYNVAEYMAVRNALRAAADAGATSAHVRMDSPVVFGHLSGASRARAEHLIQRADASFPMKARERRALPLAFYVPHSLEGGCLGNGRSWGDRGRVSTFQQGRRVRLREHLDPSGSPRSRERRPCLRRGRARSTP